jgi:arabinogalactan oligomer/maltooligosaccharide transport system permease protein
MKNTLNKRLIAGWQLLGAFLGIAAGFVLNSGRPLPVELYIICAFSAAAASVLFVTESKWSAHLSVLAFSIQAAYQVLQLLPAVRMAREGAPLVSIVFVALCALVNFAGLCVIMKRRRISFGYMVLIPMAVIWLFPIFWLIMTSFRADPGTYSSTVIPNNFTFDNYKIILGFAQKGENGFKVTSSDFPYMKWFANTLYVSVLSCLLTSIIVLSTAFSLSRLRFAGRKAFMNVLLILGMFPGFMSMIAVYYILKGLGLAQSLIALVLCYSGGAALTYYIAKGYFDTIPKSVDESALLDGATKFQLFTRITFPLSKPIVVYTLLTSFTAPWGDLIFAQIILGDKRDSWTLALGLFTMLERQYIDKWFTAFAAGAVLISVPIAALFLSLQRYYVEGLSGSVKG